MAIVRTRKTLADATPTGGARVVASGSGLPQRITTAADTVLAGISELRGGVVFDPDGLHVWVNLRTTGAIQKIRISDGATITNLSGLTTPENLSRALGSTKAYSGNTTQAYQVDLVAGTLNTFTNPVANSYHVVEGSAGKAWARTGNAAAGVYTEFTLATGVATGRTIASSWDMVYDATNNKLFALKSNGSVEKINEGTLAVELTWAAPSTTVHGIPFYGNTFRALVVDSARRPIVMDTSTGHAYRYDAASAVLDRRFLVAAAELGTPPGSTIGAARFQRQFMAFSDDDSRVCWLQANSTGGSISDTLDVRVVNIATQRARWSLPVGGNPVTVQEITAFTMGNAQFTVDAPPVGQATAHDWRQAKWYYSIDAGARTQFCPGDDLAIAVGAGSTLNVDVDFQRLDTPMIGAAPFVGGTSGTGIGVVWDDGIGGSTDTVPPVVTNVVTPAAATDFWQCDAYDVTPGWRLFQVLVQLGNEADMLVAFDGNAFKGRFAADSTRTGSGTSGVPYHLKVRPLGGWPQGVSHSVVVRFIDAAGNQTV